MRENISYPWILESETTVFTYTVVGSTKWELPISLLPVVIVQFNCLTSDFDEWALIRRVFTQNERIWH